MPGYIERMLSEPTSEVPPQSGSRRSISFESRRDDVLDELARRPIRVSIGDEVSIGSPGKYQYGILQDVTEKGMCLFLPGGAETPMTVYPSEILDKVVPKHKLARTREDDRRLV